MEEGLKIGSVFLHPDHSWLRVVGFRQVVNTLTGKEEEMVECESVLSTGALNLKDLEAMRKSYFPEK